MMAPCGIVLERRALHLDPSAPLLMLQCNGTG